MMDNLHKWFDMIDLASPTAAHMATFRRYIAFLPPVACEREYQSLVDQMGGLEAATSSGDDANIWFHVVLFSAWMFEIQNDTDGVVFARYRDRLDPRPLDQRLGFDPVRMGQAFAAIGENLA